MTGNERAEIFEHALEYVALQEAIDVPHPRRLRLESASRGPVSVLFGQIVNRCLDAF